MRNYYVYKHTFPNRKIYIGITSQKPEERWDSGYGYLVKYKDGKYRQPLMAHAVLKYGWENVQHEILFSGLTKEEAEVKEQELIAKCKSNNKDFGYNIEKGGHTNKVSEETKQKISRAKKGHDVSKETRQKISEARKGKYVGENNPFYGKKHSKETKQYLSEIHKNPSEETRKKMSENRKGKKLSDETKNKIRQNSERNKAVICIETGIIYFSATEAQRQTGIDSSSIIKVCREKMKTAGGYHWQYYIVENKAA